ncbi:hypothetical protein J8L85_14095 [Maribacter sp. MMG018]|uniref:hypothetical protein n=1 Tax=Maribacter sp. MMG018 TaxID=2822688 RepID=UPI001B391747|nr:hypothetical protein [Maribacter sp. MMG018]MBQ4915582.1 hypothetical protein [Maribacter sp. MMG018]
MNEIELLKELIEAKRIAHDLQLRIDIWTNDAERIRFVQELENISAQVENLEAQIVEVEDKRYSREAKASMIDQLERYITEINKANPRLNLSRNQGLIIENELFSGIVRDINYLVTDRVFGIHIPAYLKYTTNPDDSVSIPELTDFLRNEINILREIESPNYLILWQYKDQLIDRIRAQFIE